MLSFEERYPNTHTWVTDDGIVEIGYEPNTDSFIRALTEGGWVWQGKREYATMEAAFEDLEKGLGEWMDEQGL